MKKHIWIIIWLCLEPIFLCYSITLGYIENESIGETIILFLSMQILVAILILVFYMYYLRVKQDLDKENGQRIIELQINSIIAIFIPFIDPEKESNIKIFEKCISQLHGEYVDYATDNLMSVDENMTNKSSYFYNYRSKTYRHFCADILKLHKPMKYDSRLILLEHLFQVATTNNIAKRDIILLQNISRFFHINECDLDKLEYEYNIKQPNTEKNNSNANQAYVILGLDENSSLDDVKVAYRQLVKTCHPDTLDANASEEQYEKYAIRFRQITEAYNYLCTIKK